MSLGEFQLISKYFDLAKSRSKSQTQKNKTSKSENPYLKIGIGDDAAVIQGLANQSLNISVDTLVEGVHFPENANPKLLAKRALRVNLSDMAAMGASPKWFTLALTLPNVNESWLAQFSQGLHEDAALFGCELIGGDTTRGPLNIGIQIMGLIEEGVPPISRSGAQAGDYLVVSGTLGDAGAALSFDLNSFSGDCGYEKDATEEDYFLGRYWLPSPRIELAKRSAHLIHAACDISDGLLGDAKHIAERSGLCAVVELDKVPVTDALLSIDDNARHHAVMAGDDYELCMSVSPDNIEELRSIGEALGVPISVVGKFVLSQQKSQQEPEVRLIDSQGRDVKVMKKGYTHF